MNSAKKHKSLSERIGVAALLLVAHLLSGCAYNVAEELYPAPKDCDTENISFSANISPLLDRHCISCHNNQSAQGGVNLQGYTQVATWAQNGKLYGSVAHLPGFSPMPKGGAKLPACNVEALKAWIDSGFPNN